MPWWSGLVLLVAVAADGGAAPRPIALHVTRDALVLTYGHTPIVMSPVPRDARGRRDLTELQDALRRVATPQPDVTAITIYVSADVSADEARRVKELCVAEHFRKAEVWRTTSGRALAALPRQAPPSITITGALDEVAVHRVVDGKRGELDACVRRARERNPGLEGRLVVTFATARSGEVLSSGVTSSTLKSHELETCFATVMLTAVLPESRDGGGVVVSYPFSISRPAR